MRFILALILGIAIGGAVAWYLGQPRTENGKPAGGSTAGHANKSTRETIDDQLRALHLSPAAISNELARSGLVIREKARLASQALADATVDARTTAAIKARLVRDPELSAWNISVNTTDGVVTLSGSVASAGDIGKAMVLAMQTDGVRQVISTLQVKAK